jgi:hypothetical protein
VIAFGPKRLIGLTEMRIDAAAMLVAVYVVWALDIVLATCQKVHGCPSSGCSTTWSG